MPKLTHIDRAGNARMVQVQDKVVTARRAVATGFIRLGDDALSAFVERNAMKRDVLMVAQLAGINGAKQAGNLIPLCHPIPLTGVTVDLAVEDGGVRCTSEVTATWRTGVEMEALAAVSNALLTVYDMLKAVDKGLVIGPIKLVEKHGGKSGTWLATG
jgi:cyclic pyranopterin phosphate synthase